MKNVISHRDCQIGAAMLLISTGIGINGDHSTLTMVVLTIVAVKGLNRCLLGILRPAALPR